MTDDQVQEITTKLAGDYAVRAVTTGIEDDYDLSTITQHSTQVVPMTEQAFLSQSGATQARFWAPGTGAPVLDFPLLQVSRAGSTPTGVAVGRSTIGSRRLKDAPPSRRSRCVSPGSATWAVPVSVR